MNARIAIAALLLVLAPTPTLADPATNPAPSTPDAPTPAPTPAPAPAPAPPVPQDPARSTPPARHARDFRPSLHGFRFVNSFHGSAVPPSLRGDSGLLGAITAATDASVGTHFGLCGGMSAAAADLFLANIQPPALSHEPAEGSPLRAYLFRRQTESVGIAGVMVAKFVEWMALPDVSTWSNDQGQHASAPGWTDSAARRTAEHLPTILTRLDNGELVVLGLVHSRAGRDAQGRRGAAWENHQVLAYAYSRTEHELILHVYDPNAPGDDAARVRLTRVPEPPTTPTSTPATEPPTTPPTDRAAQPARDPWPEQYRGTLTFANNQRPVRGLFAMPYRRTRPDPAALAPTAPPPTPEPQAPDPR
jgi:hypothetical protein